MLAGRFGGQRRGSSVSLRTGRRGFTLVELLSTMFLLSFLVGLASWYYSSVKQGQQLSVARTELRRIRDAVEAHRVGLIDPDQLPESLSEVRALKGQELLDPWGTPYILDRGEFQILSSGPDLQAFTEDDLIRPLAPPRIEPVPSGLEAPESPP